jgi:DNA-binding NarL/FixJ family response regulator
VKRYRIVLADDHLLFREAIKKSIEEVQGLKVVGTAGDGRELLEILQKTPAELIILDLTMPQLQGIEVTERIKKLFPEIKILILTMHKSKEHVSRALAAGADGYLLKENAYTDLIVAIDTIRQGKTYISHLIADLMAAMVRQQYAAKGGDPANLLTAREKEVLKFIAEGKTSREIADILSITILTVNVHRRNIMKKLNVKRMADLVKYAIQFGYTAVTAS